MEADKQTMDDESKFRITGAAIWLLLLVVIVPMWYSNPVNFKPESERTAESNVEKAVVYQAYVLPSKDVPSTEPKPTLSKPEPSVSKLPEVEPAQQTEKTVEIPDKKLIPNKAELVAKTVEQSQVKSGRVPVDLSPNLKSGQWLVKVYSSKEIKDANKVLGQLDDKYEVWIKEFPKTKTFSVRTGPYASKAQAEKDKIKIDKAIRTQSELVQVK